MLKRFAVAGVFSILAAGLCASEYSDAQAKVKEKYPKEFAEVQRLAATDLEAAQKKLQELARRGNIRLPRENRQSRSNMRGRQGGFNREGWGGRGGRGGMGGMGGMGMMRMGQFNMLRRYIAESQIKAKFAEEYAAADKALLAAVGKIEELAKKAKVTLPVSVEMQIRKLRAAAPAEFAQLEELSNSDPRAVMGKLRELAEKHGIELWENRNRGQQERRPATPAPSTRENPRQVIRRLQKKYPQEMEEIMALRERNPKEFSRRLQELNRRSRSEGK